MIGRDERDGREATGSSEVVATGPESELEASEGANEVLAAGGGSTDPVSLTVAETMVMGFDTSVAVAAAGGSSW